MPISNHCPRPLTSPDYTAPSCCYSLILAHLGHDVFFVAAYFLFTDVFEIHQAITCNQHLLIFN